MARPAEELTDEGRGACRQIADTPHAIYANKQVRLATFGKFEHAALNDKCRLQDDLFGTPTAPTGKTLGHAAKSMLRKDTRILLNRGQRRLKENVGRRVVIAYDRNIARDALPHLVQALEQTEGDVIRTCEHSGGISCEHRLRGS